MLTVQANGSELTYQWQRTGVNLTDGAKYSGSTTASLRVMAVMREDEENFTCVVTNAVDSITSNAAELTLRKQQHVLIYDVHQCVCNCVCVYICTRALCLCVHVKPGSRNQILFPSM